MEEIFGWIVACLLRSKVTCVEAHALSGLRDSARMFGTINGHEGKITVRMTLPLAPGKTERTQVSTAVNG